MKNLSSLENNLLESVGVGIMITDEAGILIAVNEELCSLLGYHEEALIGKEFICLFSPQEKEMALFLFQQNLAKKTDREDSGNWHLTKISGQKIAVAVT